MRNIRHGPKRVFVALMLCGMGPTSMPICAEDSVPTQQAVTEMWGRLSQALNSGDAVRSETYLASFRSMRQHIQRDQELNQRHDELLAQIDTGILLADRVIASRPKASSAAMVEEYDVAPTPSKEDDSFDQRRFCSDHPDHDLCIAIQFLSKNEHGFAIRHLYRAAAPPPPGADLMFSAAANRANVLLPLTYHSATEFGGDYAIMQRQKVVQSIEHVRLAVDRALRPAIASSSMPGSTGGAAKENTLVYLHHLYGSHANEMAIRRRGIMHGNSKNSTHRHDSDLYEQQEYQQREGEREKKKEEEEEEEEELWDSVVSIERVSQLLSHWPELRPNSNTAGVHSRRHIGSSGEVGRGGEGRTTGEGSLGRVALLGTATAQEIIFRHQFPPRNTCYPSSKDNAGSKSANPTASPQFLVVQFGPSSNGHGIGSLLHMMASSLALAMSTGRILLLDPNDSNAFCVDPPSESSTSSSAFRCGSKRSFECFFLPLSSCSFEDALAWRKEDLGDLPLAPPPIEYYVPSRHTELASHRILLTLGDAHKTLPPQLNFLVFGSGPGSTNSSSWDRLPLASILRHSQYQDEKHDTVQSHHSSPVSQALWLWWRAQATAFIVRPNQRTRRELQRRRRRFLRLYPPPHSSTTSGDFLANSENATSNIAAARPFMVAAHVRHGDKGIEMPLVPLDNYMHAAERLLADSEARGVEGEKPHPIVFVSTEDPDVIIRSKTHWAAAAVSPVTSSDIATPNVIGVDKEVTIPRYDDIGGEGNTKAQWSLLYTDLPRENLPIFGLVEKFGGVNEMLNGLLNLQLAVELSEAVPAEGDRASTVIHEDDHKRMRSERGLFKDMELNKPHWQPAGSPHAWVGTLASNWCSLIDELRSTVAAKAGSPYVDVGFRCFQGCED